MSVDILITGTGAFAGRMLLDLAATSTMPLRVAIAGRNSDRLDWLRTAANARARMFAAPVQVESHQVDLLAPGASSRILEMTQPRVVVQAASIQTSAVIAQSGNRWTQIVAEGGLSVTAVFQALISSRMAAAIAEGGAAQSFINCCFPDVVNGMIESIGYPVLCGTGNVAILSNIFEGEAARAGLGDGRLRVLAHYQNLKPWRLPAGERSAFAAPRVFVGQQEVPDVFATFADARLTPEPAIEISGASGVTLMQALAAGRDWRGHVPAPLGLPGGYPVRLVAGRMELDLPPGLGSEEARAWNDSFERRSGITIEDKKVLYNGRLAELLAAENFPFAQGFETAALEDVCPEMEALRRRLIQCPAA